MKKTLISAVVLTALLTTGCQDQETQAKIDQLNQTVTQLTAENDRLKADLTAEKERAAKTIPAIFAEKDVIFDKTETFKYPQSKGDYVPEEGRISYSISMLKTNIDWLNTLLWEELTQEEGKVPTRDQLVENYQKHFDETRKGMMEEPSIAFESSRWVDFISQKEKLATFSIGYYDYAGGAHGTGGNRYFTLDLISHKILKLNDLFDAKALPQVKELLWENYTQNGSVKDDETFTRKVDFNVSDNIYLDSEGVHFIYSVYEIAPYAAGEPDLTLNWWQLKDLLKSDFKQQNYVKFEEDGKE
ncbi:DUF3298 domain-containing protein [Rodentibacter caecimuris]|uniref:DUF3298 domain-containing protein n=1 Tax=Rodentibacter caecimuris TaxID=1796644 RepID=UPI002248D22A|nr:DUF3298 domain-containing protein [Rodentibacter heylii]MCX2962132.1 DUF3298 domain-containing protein [Rodentibacter heylii]